MSKFDIYKQADKVAEYIMKQYSREFTKYQTMKSDELNVIKKSKQLYEWLDKVTREAYGMMANLIYKHYANEDGDLAEAWLSGILDDYDGVTKYVYTNEWERKRQRYAEGMIAGKDKQYESKLAMRLLAKQAVQYTITIADDAQIEAYKANGVKKIRWVAEDDARTCSVCKERDGNVYDINKIPPKPHYGCRCRFVPA